MKCSPYAHSHYPEEGEWLQLGDSELRAAEVLHNGEAVLLRQVRHHCHGAAECYLKAFLKRRGVERQTHKLEPLLGECVGLDLAFRSIRDAVNTLARDYPPNLLGDDGDELESPDSCSAAEGESEDLRGQLSCETSVQTHYNPQNTFTAGEATDWFSCVSEVRHFVRRRLGMEED